ncbi:MAG: hypothetical protein R3Y46_06245 [Opitutales bacterium]
MASFAKCIVFLLILSVGGLCQAGLPLWSKTNLSLDVKVVGVDAESQLITLSKGALENFGIGAYCDMSVNEEEVKTLVVVASNADKSIAMKLSDFQVQAGDTFRLKLINK